MKNKSHLVVALLVIVSPLCAMDIASKRRIPGWQELSEKIKESDEHGFAEQYDAHRMSAKNIVYQRKVAIDLLIESNEISALLSSKKASSEWLTVLAGSSLGVSAGAVCFGCGLLAAPAFDSIALPLYCVTGSLLLYGVDYYLKRSSDASRKLNQQYHIKALLEDDLAGMES